MKLLRNCILPIFLIAICCNLGVAQKKHRKRARAAIKELKEGVLIVSIPTFQKKIDTLTSLLKKDLTKKERRWLEGEFEEVIEHSNTFPDHIMEDFDQYYTFSRVLFMPDTAYTHLKSENSNSIFSIYKKDKVNLADTNFFVYKPTLLRTSNRVKKAIVDKNFIPLEPPFPNITKRPKSTSIIDILLNQDESLVRGATQAEILNKKLWEYYYVSDDRKWWHFFTREWKE